MEASTPDLRRFCIWAESARCHIKVTQNLSTLWHVGATTYQHIYNNTISSTTKHPQNRRPIVVIQTVTIRTTRRLSSHIPATVHIASFRQKQFLRHQIWFVTEIDSITSHGTKDIEFNGVKSSRVISINSRPHPPGIRPRRYIWYPCGDQWSDLDRYSSHV